ncbi:MAG: SRPBCC domain-containing protein [Candidatus Abawacabacteria bacterium]|nr:SRPBCC domain-containing protein [Candidatus Abawacabacteria bacterium]
MAKLFVEKSISITASAKTVWQVLTDPEITHEWIKEFSESFTRLESDWQLGSLVLWKDKDNKNHVEGKVTVLELYKRLRFSVMPADEVSNWEIKEDDGITYILTEENGQTLLAITQGDFGLMPEHEKYYHMTNTIWERVLPKVKVLAEWMEKLIKKGFKDIRVCPIPAALDFGEHTHEEHTVHVILDCELTIADSGTSKTYGSGDYVEFPAGTTHAVKSGPTAGSMIVGIKA